MKAWRYAPLLALAVAALWSRPATAADAPAVASPAPQPPSSDRLIISADGATISGASGGGGGSLTWLHDFNSGVLGVAGEYQSLANAQWGFGSLSGSVHTGSASAKWTFSGEVHLGSGDISAPPGSPGSHSFDYRVEGAGVAGTFADKLTVQLEAHQYDIDTTHGAMPMLGLGYLWTPHVQLTVAYSRSVSGNLGTELETLRLDHYGRSVNWLIGGAAGHVAPPIVNLYTGLTGPAPQLREGYVGVSKSFAGRTWSILGDYLKVAGERRLTLTVVCTLPVGAS
jgi:hypothetical protein